MKHIELRQIKDSNGLLQHSIEHMSSGYLDWENTLALAYWYHIKQTLVYRLSGKC